MPVKIGTFGPLSEAEFTELRQQKARKADPAMTALMDAIATGQPVRVPLVGGSVPAACGLPSAVPQPAVASPWRPSKETASSRCAKPTSPTSARQGSPHQNRGSGGDGPPSARSRTMPRSPRCKIWRPGRVVGVSSGRRHEPTLAVCPTTLRSGTVSSTVPAFRYRYRQPGASERRWSTQSVVT